MKKTWVRLAIPQMIRKQVGIATAATSSGTKASSEPNTNAKTARAPITPINVSASTPRPPATAAVAREGINPGEPEAAAVQADGCERGLDARERARNRRLTVRLARRVDEREARPPVTGDESAIAGRGVGGDARAGKARPYGAHRRRGRRAGRPSRNPPAAAGAQDRGLRRPWRPPFA